MKLFDTYLFDFDGTLVDSMPAYCHAMTSILDDQKIAYGPDLIGVITPLGTVGTARYYVEHFGYPGTVEGILEEMKKRMLEDYFYHIPAKNSVPETLCALKEKGAHLHVLTASPHITLDACLRRLGLWNLFENVWSCDDFGTTKTDPAIYHAAAQRLGKREDEILFLDDNLGADEAALAAGMKVCGVYDESSKDFEDQMRQRCHAYIRDFSQLLDF